MKKNVVLGVSGGIAAYKACELIGLLKKSGCNVDVIMTENAGRFVSRLTFETLSGNNAVIDAFERPAVREVEHIALAQKAGVFVVAPATANVIGKIANGIADDMLTTTVMAAKCAKIICPAMNTAMYENPIVRQNLDKLKDLGYAVIEPEYGILACGDVGRGRLAEVSRIHGEILRILNLNENLNGSEKSKSRETEYKTDVFSSGNTEKPLVLNAEKECETDVFSSGNTEKQAALNAEKECKTDVFSNKRLEKSDFKGKKVLITAGATRENIDGVRFISNRSSGKMGVSLAFAAAKRGAETTLIAAYIKEPLINPPFKVAEVKTTAEMFDAVLSRIKDADIIIKAAAPADYRLKTEFKNKVKSQTLTLEFEKNPDIAAAVGKVKTSRQRLVIFNAETENLLENAVKKLKSKNADMVVANDVTKEGAGFDTDTNIVTIITKDGKVYDCPKLPKAEVADIILDRIGEILYSG
ncbi:MAG: bifunctional phosphopantothenoylcysteine decarboxylase/phosphopantothenate synthase [Clostridiales bacterium]|jgi:phosphopantothenoylcysteine decarboxylase/phosphopantothenate--cysteine ligase|nr:bifunctional phosphopantothenoylcysteine decarboxylase/phosphopantothenate synthase [Clostridiales bacterium]